MGVHIAKNDESLKKIAQIMSKKANCKITTDDIRTDVFTVTTSIYSAVVHEKVGNSVSARSVICTVRKWKNPYEYEVVIEKI